MEADITAKALALLNLLIFNADVSTNLEVTFNQLGLS
jgi:hypothetical protein